MPRRFDQPSPVDLLALAFAVLGAAAITLRWLATHGDNALDIDFDEQGVAP